MRIYGPYKRKDGRQHIVIVHLNGQKQTKSYPRYLLEKHLGRELLPKEHVDHIDHDFTNNSIDNLQILTIEENGRKEMLREHRKAKMHVAICPTCSTTFEVEYRKYKRNQLTLKKDGPFCSKSCVGKKHY